MTPAARFAAAIEIVDRTLSGVPAEQALTGWARGNRFAGSKDRAAIRDIVFQAERRRASAAAMGGAMTGRGVILGLIRQSGVDPSSVFGADRYAPAPLGPGEIGVAWDDLTPADAADLQPWIFEQFEADHPGQAAQIGAALRDRAPIFIRANTARVTREDLAGKLAECECRPHPTCNTALEVTANARRLSQSQAWGEGLFEMQDAASQMAVDALPLQSGDRVLDYCAGGGGKSLALAARGARVVAHDVDAKRMADIPARAARAGVSIERAGPGEIDAVFGLVVVDAPCSGSGTWRRAPGPKWTLDLAELQAYQTRVRDILAQAWGHVAPGGAMAFMTCSVFRCENADQADWAAAALPGARVGQSQQRLPDAHGDGFYWAHIHKA